MIIDFKQRKRLNIRSIEYYLKTEKYNKWYTLQGLAELEECPFTKVALRQRFINSAVRYETVWDAITRAKTIAGRKITIKHYIDFDKLMKLWKTPQNI